MPFLLSKVAAMIGSELFFDPEAVMLPEIRRPPLMTSLSMYVGRLMKKPIFTIISGYEKQIIFFSGCLRRKDFILYLELTFYPVFDLFL